jgi:nucleotide-binding universal stress UspA family protein
VWFVGIDWAETHHDVCMLAADGQPVATARVPDGIGGVTRLHELAAEHAGDPAQVVVGSRPTGACWSPPWSLPATRCTRSTRWRPAAIGNGM